MSANVILNEEKNGIEIRFDGKPEAEVIEALKSNGFRWSGKQKMWFAKQTDERMTFVNEMFKSAMDSNPCGGSSVSFKNKTEKQAYDLWEMTRTEDIPNNFELHKIYDTKEIAAIVRKHIKPRFPMCKLSIRSDYNSIDVDLLASPFAKGSDELKAIVHYIYVFVESYNYNNSDSMTDYFDVNFYFSSEGNIVSYRYEQTEMNESIEGMVTVFQQKRLNGRKQKPLERKKNFRRERSRWKLTASWQPKQQRNKRLTRKPSKKVLWFLTLEVLITSLTCVALVLTSSAPLMKPMRKSKRANLRLRYARLPERFICRQNSTKSLRIDL